MARSDPPSPAHDAGSPQKRIPGLLLLAIISLFCALAWISARHVNALWDETTDHQVAVSLMTRPLVGSPLDATQARLPMYVSAAAYAVAGPSIRVARAMSIAMGAAAIALTFVAGRRWFSTSTGLFAAALLSISPLFLTFSRTGLTEGDAFCPATVLLMLLAFDAYLQNRNSPRLILFAAALGLALTAKFYTVFFVPALILADLVEARRNPASVSPTAPARAKELEKLGIKTIWAWTAAAFGAQFFAAVFAQLGLHRAAVLFWAVGLLVLLAGVLEHFLLATPDRRTARQLTRWNTFTGWPTALLLAGAVCAAICPAHVLNPDVARALVRSLIHPVEPEPMLRVWDPARLYLGILLIKLGPPLGILSLVAIPWACFQTTNRRPAMLCASIVIYILFLLILPLRQPFYLMSVYPLIILTLTAFVRYVWLRLQKRELLTSAWIALVSTSCLYLLWGTITSYPEFGYYGYNIVGKRWLGAESRGYRNLIQVTNDGTQDAMAWLTAHVPAGRRVVSYLWDDHVIDQFFADQPPKFQIVRRNAYLARWTPPEIEDADFVVVALNNETSYHDLPPQSLLHEKFGLAGGHVVWRGRGSAAMPVVQIFARDGGGASGTAASGPASSGTTSPGK